MGKKIVWICFSILLVVADLGFSQPISDRRTLSGALVQEPGSVLLSMKLVDAFECEGNAIQALSIVNDLLMELPKNHLLILKRGNLYLNAGQQILAKADFEAVLEMDDGNLDALYGLIKTHERLQDWERSLSFCQSLLKENPENPFAILHSGWSCFVMKRYKEALEWYSHKGLSRRREMILGRGWSLIKLNNVSMARQAFEEVTAFNPLYIEGLNGLREVDRMILNEQVSAVSELDETNMKHAFELLPKLREQGRISEAMHLSNSLLAREPMNPLVLAERGRLFSQTGRWIEAEQCFSLLLKSAPSIEFIRGRMTALFSLGRLNEAGLSAREVLKTASEDAFALKIVADDYYAIGKFEKALEFYQRLPDDLWAWQGKGWCHLVLGDLPSARKAFRSILVRYPGNPVALEGLKRTGE